MISRLSFGARSRRVFRTLVVALALILSLPAALASFKANVYTDSMKVYSYPSASSKYYIGSLDEGTEFTVTAYRGNWARISYKGKSGYALIACMASQSRAKAYTQKSTPVYRAASSSSKKLGTLSAGETVYVSGKCGSYYLIENGSGSVSGYVYKSYIGSRKHIAEDDKNEQVSSGLKSRQTKYSASLSNAKKIEYVIYVAQNLLGRPYSYSPSAPYSFDCSRFVKYCFGKAGVSLSGGSYEQGYDDTHERVSDMSSLKRGDVVCFNTDEDDDDLCDHTGIYLGGGYFVHASSSAGEVIVSSITSDYYTRTFSWGLRIFD